MYVGRYEIYYQDIPAKSRYLNAVGGVQTLGNLASRKPYISRQI